MVRAALRVLDAMLEEDRTALSDPRYAHQTARAASRAGTIPSEVVLGGRQIAVVRQRMCAAGHDVPPHTCSGQAQDPLNDRGQPNLVCLDQASAASGTALFLRGPMQMPRAQGCQHAAPVRAQ